MNLFDNKVLLWSASICALATFPILYIPCVPSLICSAERAFLTASSLLSLRVISDYVFQVVGIVRDNIRSFRL